MAIIQISRIQNRRGRKLTDTGMPQLSSGELGWAIDTQELYIGNGSIGEGAPQQGNTKVLTEHDNIFDLADQYKYKQNNNLWGTTTPAALTVQQKLDEFVSVAAFGAAGDNTIQTTELQNALDSLYIRASSTNDIVNLYIPAGKYRLNGPLYVPPFAKLIGAGVGKTIFYTDDTAFITCNGDSTVGNYKITNNVGINEANTNQAREISISGMSILPGSNRVSSPTMILHDTANSSITDIYMEHEWTTGENEANQVGIKLVANSTTPSATCENIFIEHVEFNGFNSAILSENDIQNINIRNNKFVNARRAISFADTDNFILGSVAQTVGPSYCNFENNSFDLIDREGIYVGYGKYNKSTGNKFYNVGNNAGNYNTAITPCIAYETDSTNTSDNDYFERFNIASNDNNTQRRIYVPEVTGAPYNCNFVNRISMPTSANDEPFLKLPAIENGKVIVYFSLRDRHDAENGNPDFTEVTGMIEATIINSSVNASAVISLGADYSISDHTSSYTSSDFVLSGQIEAQNEYAVDGASIDLSQPVVKLTHNLALFNEVFQYKMEVLPVLSA